MDNESSNHRQNSPKSNTLQTTSRILLDKGDKAQGEQNIEVGGDPMVWAAFTDNFSQVQSVLDRNRFLIQQVNENHRSKIHDNLVKNVALIQEINGNISKVVSLYANLSTEFSSMFRQRNGEADAKSNSEEKSCDCE